MNLIETYISFALALSVKDKIMIVVALAPSIFLLVVTGPLFWMKQKFRVHRLGGFLFLLQYAVAWYIFLTDYQGYKSSYLLYTVQVNGVAQAVSAIYTFKFLQKQKTDPGFYGDKGAITYPFIKENLFYQLLTMFGFIYYNDAGYQWMRSNIFGLFFELIWVFYAFVIIRPLFPKTHFRDALSNAQNNRTQENQTFYLIGTYVIKVFYLCAKHYMGFFIQYVRFFDGFDMNDQYLLNWMLLANCGTVSIAVFLHTLRFKKILNPRLAFSIYVILAYTPFLGAVNLGHIFSRHWLVLVLTTAGLLINLLSRSNLGPWAPWLEALFQTVLCVGFSAHRAGAPLI